MHMNTPPATPRRPASLDPVRLHTIIEMLYANLPRVVRPPVEYALTTQTLGVEHSFTGTLTQDGEHHDGAQQTMMTAATTCTAKSLCFVKSSFSISTHCVVVKVQRVQCARVALEGLRKRACAVSTHFVVVKVQRVQCARVALESLRERACAVLTHSVVAKVQRV